MLGLLRYFARPFPAGEADTRAATLALFAPASESSESSAMMILGELSRRTAGLAGALSGSADLFPANDGKAAVLDGASSPESSEMSHTLAFANEGLATTRGPAAARTASVGFCSSSSESDKYNEDCLTTDEPVSTTISLCKLSCSVNDHKSCGD